METQSANPPEHGRMEWARQLAYRLHLPTTLVKFLIVGGIGFLINQFALFLLYDSPVFWFLPGQHTSTSLGLFTHGDIRLLISSIVAVEVAIVCQFNFHDRWTFRHRNRGGNILTRFLKYNLSSAISPFITVLSINLLTPVIRDQTNEGNVVWTMAPYIANTIGVGLGFIWNWTLNSLVIWPHQQEEAPAEG